MTAVDYHRAIQRFLSDYSRGATIVPRSSLRMNILNHPITPKVTYEFDHYHHEAGSLTTERATAVLVSVADSGAWAGVCTCGQRFLYAPDTP